MCMAHIGLEQVTLDNNFNLITSSTTLSHIEPFSCRIGLASCISCRIVTKNCVHTNRFLSMKRKFKRSTCKDCKKLII